MMAADRPAWPTLIDWRLAALWEAMDEAGIWDEAGISDGKVVWR